MKELIYKKGILLKVSSWENDGDHYKTIDHQVDTLDEAKAIKRMCDTLFKSHHSSKSGISNDWGASLETYEEDIIEFMSNDEYFKKYPVTEMLQVTEGIIDDVLGYSEEGYSCRVCDSCEIYNVKEDIHIEKV